MTIEPCAPPNETIESPDIETILIKDGEHRLSEPHDLARLWLGVGEVCEAVGVEG